jgi:two-component system sensor histidine kinase YesM
MVIITLIASNFIAGVVAHPLISLANRTKQVINGNLDVQFDVSGSEEIDVLNSGMQELIVEVKQLLEKVKQEQELIRHAEMEVLQAQIKPHFLYNTLDAIKQLCELGENKEASSMVLALSRFYRVSLSRGSEIIPIEDELRHIDNYLVILSKRYFGEFSYQYAIDDTVRTGTIVKLTLQPLIENAVYHGLKQKRGGGILTITAQKKGEKIVFLVEDDGVGMEQSQLDAIREDLQSSDHAVTSGFGIKNVHQRLQLNYGDEYGLDIVSKPGEGTTITVTIPFMRKEDRDNVESAFCR